MKKSKFVLFFLQCLLFWPHFCRADVEFERDVGTDKVIFRFSDPMSLALFVTPANTSKADSVLQNLQLFEKEMTHLSFLQGAQFEFILAEQLGPGFFSDFMIKASPIQGKGEGRATKIFKIQEVKFQENALSYMKFEESGAQVSGQDTFVVYNLAFDEKGNVLDRVILKTELDPSFVCDAPFFKFREGRLMEYRDYQGRALPGSATSKTFVLAKDGKKVWTHVKSVFNRKFNEQGLVTQETTQGTDYNDPGLEASHGYAVYNVTLDERGEVAHYEIVFPRSLEDPILGDVFLEVDFERNEVGTFLKTLIRKYKIADGVKQHLEGRLQEFDYEDSRLRHTRETDFSIKPGTSGASSEGRISNEALDVWNLSFDENGEILFKRILKTAYEDIEVEGVKKRLRLFRKLREIRQAKAPSKGVEKEWQVDELDYLKDQTLAVTRQVRIEILESLPTGAPVKLKLTVQSPLDPALYLEQVVGEDCDYIMEEAVSGDLFSQSSEREFEVAVQEISEKGEILQAVPLTNP